MDSHTRIHDTSALHATRPADRAQPSAAAGGLPPTVIRGESSNPHPDRGETDPRAAFTDFLNVTYPLNGSEDPLGDFLDSFYSVAGPLFGRFEDRGRGIHRWERSFAAGGAMFAFGGQRDRALLSLSGDGCALVEDWDALTVWLRDWCDARITRWDGAVDDYEGLHSVNDAATNYQTGAFKCGGRQPGHSLRGDWLDPKGQGRTFYVGNRKNGKLFRVYEKGMQLGDPTSPWTRHEVELHNVDREIPWEVLWQPGKYVSGAYPYLSWVNEESSRIRTIQESATISLAFLTEHCRRAYGTLLNTLRRQGMTDSQIVSQLSRNGVPARLALATLLGVRGDPQ